VPLTLYGYGRSSNALKVRFLLAELGLAYEHAPVPAPQPRPAELLAVNTLG
jgi:glutathione S-transferase